MGDGFLVGVVSVLTVLAVGICIRHYDHENNRQLQNEDLALHQEVNRGSQINEEREKRVADGFQALEHGCKEIANLRKQIETAKASNKKALEVVISKPFDEFEIKK